MKSTVDRPNLSCVLKPKRVWELGMRVVGSSRLTWPKAIFWRMSSSWPVRSSFEMFSKSKLARVLYFMFTFMLVPIWPVMSMLMFWLKSKRVMLRCRIGKIGLSTREWLAPSEISRLPPGVIVIWSEPKKLSNALEPILIGSSNVRFSALSSATISFQSRVKLFFSSYWRYSSRVIAWGDLK